MSEVLSPISSQIKYQFPELYDEYGPDLITFVETYYEWMETRPDLGNSRQLLKIRDIDDTPKEFLEHFKNKYMAGLPAEILGNQRLLQKHILELYRAKGSINGLKILFRLLYNEDVDVYVPARDILKASDSSWTERQYLEISQSDDNVKFHEKIVTGLTSKATALVESFERKTINNKLINVLYISSPEGRFLSGELISYAGYNGNIADLPSIMGSPSILTPITSGPGFKIGDVVEDPLSSKTGTGLKAVVTSTFDSIGTINFTIEDPGYGYSLDAEVAITTGSNTSGAGANFFVSGITDTELYEYSTEYIRDSANVPLNATAFNFPIRPAANVNTVIGLCLELNYATIGRISQITTTNPGVNYNGDVTVTVTDPYLKTRRQPDEDGTGRYTGFNAVISGRYFEGVGIVNGLKIIDTGFGYYNQSDLLYLSDTTRSKVVTTQFKNVTSGKSEGYFNDTRSHLSSDKYLQDGYYYQEYSYEIISTKPLAKYNKIVKDLTHLVGNELFGKIRITDTQTLGINKQPSRVDVVIS